MNIPPALLRLLLSLLAAAALASGCVPGQGIQEPEPEPPAEGLCESDADCAASPKAPVCGEALSCRGCEDHGECASSFCNRDTGACVDESAVAYVAQGGTGDCSRGNPCGAIATALDLVRADNETRSAIRIGGGTYRESIALSDVRVRIAGDDATIQLGQAGPPAIPAPDPTHGAAVVSVGERAHVVLEGVRIQGDRERAGVSGLHCFGGTESTLQLRQVTVADHAGLGILAQGCFLTLARSAVTHNAGGGLLVLDAAFDVTNSYFLDNGDVDSSPVSGVTIRNDEPVTSQRFAFNTVTGNQAGPDAAASGVTCAVSSASYMLASSNIILVGLGGKRSAAGDCPWRHSLLEGLSPIDTGAFFYQKNVDSDCMVRAREDGLPSITAGAPCADRGEPELGILVDYDGNPRSPTAPDIGADEL